MQPSQLSIEELENVWSLLADMISNEESGRQPLVLTKLALLLASEVGDFERVAACIREAARDRRPAPSHS